MLKPVLRTMLLLACMFPVQAAYAADTTETFDVGATDFEFCLGFDGLGLDKYEKTVSGEALLGYGFMDGFSGYLAASGESNEYFGDGGGLSFGVFGTPLDTEHIDLDLFLDAGVGSDEFGVTPALELNFDRAPDLELWGVYLRVEEGLAGRDESVDDDPTTAADESETKFVLAPATGLTFGTYWTVAPEHQLLLEYDMSLANNPGDDEDTLEIGGVALGYNVVLSESIELINQVYFDLPQSEEDFAFGFGFGIIVTMPSAAAAPATEEVEPET